MSDGLHAIPATHSLVIQSLHAQESAARYSLVIPAPSDQAAGLARRKLLGLLTPTELMEEIVAIDGALDVVR
jgi:hypothetical protein